MKRILFAGAATLVAMGQALAADLPQPYSPPPPHAPARYVPAVAPVYNWGGIYVGLNGGYAFGNSDWTNTLGATTGNFNVNGGLVGGTIGANYQMGQFVMGIEADGDWTGISGSTSTTCGAVPCKTSNDWLGTVRGRLGFAWDRVLMYGTAGGAGGNIKASQPGSGATTNNDKFGWTAGAGLEVAITDNLTAKVEYLFVDLSNSTFSCTVCGGGAPSTVKFDTSLVRAGLNFKFNGF